MEHVLSIVARCLSFTGSIQTKQNKLIYGTFGILNEDYDRNDNPYYWI